MARRWRIAAYLLAGAAAIGAGALWGLNRSVHEPTLRRMTLSLGQIQEISLPIDSPAGVRRARLVWLDTAWYLDGPPLHLADGERVRTLIDSFLSSRLTVLESRAVQPHPREGREWIFSGSAATVTVYPASHRCPRGTPVVVKKKDSMTAGCMSGFSPVPVALAWILERRLVPPQTYSSVTMAWKGQTHRLILSRAGRCVLDGAMAHGAACSSWIGAWTSMSILHPRPGEKLSPTATLLFDGWRLRLGTTGSGLRGAQRGREAITVEVDGRPWKLLEQLPSLLSPLPFSGPIPLRLRRTGPFGRETVQLGPAGPGITDPGNVPYDPSELGATLGFLSVLEGRWSDATDFVPDGTISLRWPGGLEVAYEVDLRHCRLGYPFGRILSLPSKVCVLMSRPWASSRPLGWRISSLESFSCGSTTVKIRGSFAVAESPTGRRALDVPHLPDLMVPIRYGTVSEGLTVRVHGPGTTSSVVVGPSGECQVRPFPIVYGCSEFARLAAAACTQDGSALPEPEKEHHGHPVKER